MAYAAPRPPASLEADYEAHRRYGLEYLRKRWPQFNQQDREDIVDDVFRSLVERGVRDGFAPKQFRPYFTKAIERRAKHEVRRRHGRATFPVDPNGGPFVDADERTIDEQVIGKLDAENVTTIIEALNPLQRACAKMRFDYGLMPREIAAQLGVDQRRVDKALERSTARIRRGVEQGDFGARYGELIDRLVAGTATPRQRAQALAVLKTSSQARMIHAAMLRDGRQLGAQLAGPLVASEEPTRSRVAELLAHAKQQLLDACSATKGQVSATYARGADTTQHAGHYLASLRPGAATALIASCLAATGGAVCVVGDLGPFGEPPRASQAKGRNEPKPVPQLKRPAAVVTRPPATSSPRRAQPAPRRPTASGTASAPAPSAGATNLGGLGGSPQAPAPTTAPAPIGGPAPATGGGEFGGLAP